MNIIDLHLKCVHLIECHTTMTAMQAAELFHDNVWCHHGLPLFVHCDQGTQFVAEFTCELYRLLGIKINSSTAYHPQLNGQVERLNQEMEQYLRIFVSKRQNDW